MNKKLRVLIVEDNPADVELLRDMLGGPEPGRFDIAAVPRLSAGMTYVTENRVDAVLLDLGLPDSQGLPTFNALKAIAPQLAIIVLTGNGDQALAIAAVQAGAQDYLIKGQFAADLLTRAILYAVERQHTRRDLQASELRFRSIFDHVMDGILLIDPQTTAFVMANQAMCTMLGYPEASLLRFKLSDVSREQDRQAVEGAFVDEYRGEPRVAHDVPLKRKDGTVVFTDVNFAPITIDDRNLLMGSFRDVTERRALQASVAQADRLASLGMLAAGVAHEINNPLAYVLYNVESLALELPPLFRVTTRCCSALRNEAGDAQFAGIVGDDAELLWPATLEDTLRCARDALSGTQRIKEIARGLGTFSRVESTELSEVDLQYTIDCAVNMAFNEIKYRARLVKDYGNVPPVWASEGKLSQVFLNLIINAAHAIGEGNTEQHRIGIRTWVEGNNVLAEVADTGKGIPPENLERIFEPFFTTKPVGVGSGLGLAICRRIVTDFGGTISVESEVGRGTRFVIRLPTMRYETPEQEVPPPSRRSRAPVLGGRILVVDDDESIRRMLQRMLGREHDVVTAESGEEGRSLLEADRSFEVILCDLMMPAMSGMDLHAWLIVHYPLLAERMIFLTGGAFTPAASAFLGHIGNLSLDKPVNTDELRHIVMRQVVEVRQHPSPPAPEHP
jgi:PAS domain S-box-containing protein